jgi:release factor glutamine methyltransferase
MQIRDALQSALKTLTKRHVPSAELAAELLLMHVLDSDRSYLHSHPEIDVPPETADRYFRLIAERTTGKPTQYITGHQEFWGLDFEVTPDVLIPRPETEHVVEAVIGLSRHVGAPLPEWGKGEMGKRENGKTPKGELTLFPHFPTFPFPPLQGVPLHIADVGTGSGCIALALASALPEAEIYATDISRPALVVAARNAVRLGLQGCVRFEEGDLLDPLLNAGLSGTFDFVASNPPYVAQAELDRVQREVRDFEPRVAWGGLERGEQVYAQLFPQALEALKPGGYVVVEIGYNMRDRVCGLLGCGWSETQVRSDLAGIPRVVIARKIERLGH